MMVLLRKKVRQAQISNFIGLNSNRINLKLRELACDLEEKVKRILQWR